MKIHSDDLQKIFKYLSPSINSQQKLIEYNSFLFETNNDNLCVRISDGITESVIFMTGEFEPIKFAVDKFIYDIISVLNGEIELSVKDTTLFVTCEKENYEFATVDSDNWIEIISKPELTYDLNDLNGFKQLVKKSRHCVSVDETRLIYNGYHIRDCHLLVSDGFRAIVSPFVCTDVSFKQKEIDKILSVIDGKVKYNFDDFIYFAYENDKFSGTYYTDCLRGEPANLKKVIEEYEEKEVILKLTFDKLAKNIKPFLIMQQQARKIGDGKYLLTITCEDGIVYFGSTVSGVSNNKNEIDCIANGQDYSITVNPKQLEDYVKIANGQITMKMYGKREPVLFYDETDSKYLLMPHEQSE